MIYHSLFVRKCHSIDTLQRVVVLVATKVTRGVLEGYISNNDSILGRLRITFMILKALILFVFCM